MRNLRFPFIDDRWVPFLLTALLALAFTTACGAPSASPDSAAEPGPVAVAGADDDPYIWLEEVDGEEALAWVAEQNAASLPGLEGDPRFVELEAEALALMEASDRIPYGSYFGGYVHNFWRDENHVRGIWRRTTLDSYATDDPGWETILDIDALADAESENWVYKGRSCLPPEYNICFVNLSRGGGDAVVIREFDVESRSFVEDGFMLPEAKSRISWIDENTVFVGTDTGEGSLTSSGYPRTVSVWERGTPLSDARLIAEANEGDVAIGGYSVIRPEGKEMFIGRTPAFFKSELFHVGEDLKPVNIPLQEDASFRGLFGDRMLVTLRSDWEIGGETFAKGTLVSLSLAGTLESIEPADVDLVYAPSDRGSIRSVSPTRDELYVGILEEVTGTLLRVRRTGDAWDIQKVDMPANGTVSTTSADDFSDVAMINYESFLVPDRLYLVQGGNKPRVIKSLPERFDASGFITEQRFAASSDGERIPYFLIRQSDLPMDGNAPTLQYAYGGFEISLTPSYVSPGTIGWLKRGGVYVVANIRGGGEFGPKWHEAALLEKRQVAFDDMIAVSEDLIDSGITSPEHLGISGGSNGGLLVGAVAMQRPELYGAVVSAVPLLDMMRYHTLLAGASWMAEYGNPEDPEMRDVILAYSPYQSIRQDGDYPEIFFWTNTRDDRVHPGHPRKMVARMREQGHPVLYYENTEGGHGSGANLKQRAKTTALTNVYLMQRLTDVEGG
jgi:prolyl oligopeptidase